MRFAAALLLPLAAATTPSEPYLYYEFYENDRVEIPIHNGSFGIFLSKNVAEDPISEVSNGVNQETVKIIIETWADECRNFWKEFVQKLKCLLVVFFKFFY